MSDDPPKSHMEPEGDFPAGVPPGISPTPDYELLRLIGRGSYGEVWLARDKTGVYRAVKVVFRESFDHDRPYEREFDGIRKFEPVSRSYDHQVQILHVGRQDDQGRFYYIMELADDQRTGQQIDPRTYEPKTLKSELRKRGRFPVEECLRIAAALARALENLHQHGLIHRDIKPGNIIFVNGVPKLADIGLVTDRDVSVSYVGTEGYIPPEGPSSAQADIFSLGKVLYEMAMGRDRMDFPKLPTNLEGLPDREELLELNAVIAKACERDPRRRYQSAREMFADLARVQEGKSLRNRKGWRGGILVATKLGTCAALLGAAAWGVHRFASQQGFKPGASAMEASTEAMANRRVPPSPKPPVPGAGRWTNSLGMVLVPVPGTMVRFCIWDTRVQDYLAFALSEGRGWTGVGFKQGPTHPVVNVSWEDAHAFCDWLTTQERRTGHLAANEQYRLPTDAEWSVAVGLDEPAAGTPKDKDGKIDSSYPWGAVWPPPREAGNYAKTLKVDDYDYTSPVGSFQSNRFGLYDMGGNVWQWCEDWYDGTRQDRVLRGGSWGLIGPSDLRSSFRGFHPAADRYISVGFRCVLTVAVADARGGLSVNTKPSGATAARPAGLVAYYPFDTDANDYSGNGNHGVLEGATLVSDGKVGGALQCNGGTRTYSHVIVPSSPSLVSMQQTRQFTCAAWIRPQSVPLPFPGVLCKGGNATGAYGGYELALNGLADNDLVFDSGACLVTTSGAKGRWINNQLNEWIHIAFTLDATSCVGKFYVNGQETGDASLLGSGCTGLNFAVPNRLYIGRSDPADAAHRSGFNGRIDEVMIFNRVLPAREIRDIYLSTGFRPQ